MEAKFYETGSTGFKHYRLEANDGYILVKNNEEPSGIVIVDFAVGHENQKKNYNTISITEYQKFLEEKKLEDEQQLQKEQNEEVI